MNGKTHAFRRTAALGATVAAMLLAIPLATAGQHKTTPDQDGWYYTAIRHRQEVGSGSACRPNRTFEQASRAGVLPEVYAALHGTVPSGFSLGCGNHSASS